MKIKSDFLKSLLSVGVGSLFLDLGRLVTVLISTRYIAPEELGVYFIVIAAAGIITSIAAAGTNLGLVKYVVEEEHGASKNSTVVSMVLFFSMSLLAVIGLALVLNREFNLINIQPLYTVLCLSFGLFFYLDFALQGLKQFKDIAVSNMVNGISKAAVSLVLIAFMGMGLEGLLWSIIISNILGISIQAISLRRSIKRFGFESYGTSVLKRIIRFSFPMYLNQLYSNLYDRGYMVLVATMLDPVAVAYYGIAKMIPSYIDRLRQVFNSVYFPKLCAFLKEKDIQKGIMLLSVSITAIFITTSIGSIIYYMFKEYIVRIAFTDEYVSVSLAIFILMGRSALSFCSAIMGFSLIALGCNSAPLKINIFITTISFAASYFVIPYYGYIGVVYVAFVSSMLGFAINYLYLRHVGFPVSLKGGIWVLISIFIVIVFMLILKQDSSALLIIYFFMTTAVYAVYTSGVHRLMKRSV